SLRLRALTRWASSDCALYRSPLPHESLVSSGSRPEGQIPPLLGDHQQHGRRRDWRRVAVVAHGGVNNAIIGRVLGTEEPGLAKVEQDFGCVNIIDFLDDRPMLRLLNFTAYDPLKTGLEISSLDVMKAVLETALQVALDERPE
ncbi:MAG: histidine phosphatase family protein, partial [Deltaproteobacteria bacterium]|nr:histidine phosphatase family protein [Deltaproteobacteria bacterium]